jgi:hypothetical protein
MTRTTVTVLLVGGCLVTACGEARDLSKPDFSGSWVLDLSRSSLEIAPPDSSIFVIEHDDPDLVGRRTHYLGGVSDASSAQLTTDSVLAAVRAGDLEIPTRVYWDGHVLVLDQAWTRGDVRITNLVRYTLEDGGQTLIADERMSADGDTHHNVWVFGRR